MKNLIELNKFAEISAGGGAPQESEAFSENNEGNPFVRAGSLVKLLSGETETSLEHLTDDVARKYRLRLFPKDTILFAKSGMSATKGYIYQLKQPSYVVNHLAAIVPKKELLFAPFLKYWFQQNPPSRLIKDEAYPSIRLSEISEIKIPKISVDEQKRIAAVLDKADEVRAKRRAALEKLDSLLQSVFLDMFGDPVSNPKGWETVKIGEIAPFVSSGSTPLGGSTTYLSEGILFIRSQNVLMNSFDFSDAAFISDETHSKMRRTWVKNGDVLFNITGASIGRVHHFTGEDDSANVNQHVSIIRPNRNKVRAEFLSRFLSMPSYQRKIMVGNAGATRQAFNFEQIRNFPFLVPPMEIQNKFIEINKKITNTRKNLIESENENCNLFQSLQQRAFSGELFSAANNSMMEEIAKSSVS